MGENELNFIDDQIKDEFFFYVENNFGSKPKSKIRALKMALEDWISNEQYNMELTSLINDLNNTEGINAPRHAAHALREYDDKKAINALNKALNHEDIFVRRKAAVSLGYICDESSIKPLIIALKDEDSNVRSNADWSLSVIGESAIDPLIDALSSRNKHVRSGAASALNKMELISKFADLKKAIIESLDDEYNVVRRRAISTLEKMDYKDNTVTYALIDALDDNDLLVRQNALITLGKIGNEHSLEYIIRARSDEDSRIRESAEEAWSIIKERIMNDKF